MSGLAVETIGIIILAACGISAIIIGMIHLPIDLNIGWLILTGAIFGIGLIVCGSISYAESGNDKK